MNSDWRLPKRLLLRILKTFFYTRQLDWLDVFEGGFRVYKTKTKSNKSYSFIVLPSYKIFRLKAEENEV